VPHGWVHLSNTYKNGDLLELKIEKIVPRGLGLAFAEGLTVFVPLAAAGDKLRVRIEQIKGKTAFAEIEEVIEPSADRVAPACEYFGVCGGCDFMHLKYGAQLAAKVAMVRDCLERIGKIEFAEEIAIIPSPEEFGYRLRAQWHADAGKGSIGYYRRNSRDLVDIENCMVLDPALQARLKHFRSDLDGVANAAKTAKIDVAAGDDGQVSVFSDGLNEPAEEIAFSAAGERYVFSARSFFQGNRFLINKLIETAVGDASGGTALDLYSGVGLFTLALARRFKIVIGVEENEEAVEFADRNAMAARLGNIDFYAASVRDYLASGEAAAADLVLLDPPRFGTEKETMMNLIRLEPKRVSYVACEPSILARDLKRFVENGYRIKSITALDLFPQTHHVETVVHLVRGGSGDPAGAD
jgi:23S rRNA (uracil1939-C5)-methyltransferase